MVDIIKEFYDARKKKGLSVRKLAKLIGVSYETIRKYEFGMFPPNEETWDKLKSVLELTGTVEKYWGRRASKGRNKKYEDDSKCKIDGCSRKPVARGMCLKHYNRERYVKVKKKIEAAKKEARNKLRG